MFSDGTFSDGMFSEWDVSRAGHFVCAPFICDNITGASYSNNDDINNNIG
jgi:hypothetical protein